MAADEETGSPQGTAPAHSAQQRTHLSLSVEPIVAWLHRHHLRRGLGRARPRVEGVLHPLSRLSGPGVMQSQPLQAGLERGAVPATMRTWVRPPSQQLRLNPAGAVFGTDSTPVMTRRPRDHSEAVLPHSTSQTCKFGEFATRGRAVRGVFTRPTSKAPCEGGRCRPDAVTPGG